VASVLAIALAATVVAALGATPAPAQAAASLPPDSVLIHAGMTAPAHDLDHSLTDSTFVSWIRRTLGDVPLDWEVNDCGEATGRPADSARDLPVCVEASTALSGGRELYISIAVGTMNQGILPPPDLWGAGVEGPDTSLWFQRLPDVEQYLSRERPATG